MLLAQATSSDPFRHRDAASGAMICRHSGNPSSAGMKLRDGPIDQVLARPSLNRGGVAITENKPRVIRVFMQETMSVPCHSRNAAHVESGAVKASRSVSTVSPCAL
jgi:hypothetical protein